MKGGAAFPVRLRYGKRGKVRWISHRDVCRAFERAFRIAELPLAFSEGFSPHPKVSFGLALSTGHESDAEYLDCELAAEIDLSELPGLLSEALPEGMAVTGAAALAERAPALQEAVTSVEWLVEVARDDGTQIPGAELRDHVAAGLALDTLETMRYRKGRQVTEDVRPVIRRCDVLGGTTPAAVATIEMECSVHPRSAKPGEVLAAIATGVGVPGGLIETRALRTHQWIERDGARREPLDADTRPRVPEVCAS